MSKPNLADRIGELLARVKKERPLVHHITNYVTANDCANVVLAIGASPVMADDMGEVEEVVSMASALVINTGTLHQRTIDSMLAAGKKANELGVPIVLDPVGAGATALRNSALERLLGEIKPAVIRGNMSEIKALSGLGAATKGVDVSEQDRIKADNLIYCKNVSESLASILGCVVAVTGAVDIVSGKDRTYFIHNGHPMLSNITGTGCMCSSLIGVYCAVADDYIAAAAAGILTMGVAGEKAYESAAAAGGGCGTFRMKLFDSIHLLSDRDLRERGNVCEG